MNETTQVKEISPYHTAPESKLTIKRILEKLREEFQQETAENEATKKFAENLTKLEEEYNSIPEIVSKYQTAYINFVGAMKTTAKRNWDDIESWSDDMDEVPENIAKAITDLRKGEFYEKKEQVLKGKLRTAWWEYHSELSNYDYFAAKEVQKANEFNTAKEFEKTVNGWFADLEKLHAKAKEYMEAKKYKSVYAVRLEYEEIWNRTLELDDGSSTAKTPEWLKTSLTEKLRILIAAMHESYLWHNKQLKNKDEYQTAKDNYDSFIKTRRESFIREAQDVQPLSTDTGSGGPGRGDQTADKSYTVYYNAVQTQYGQQLMAVGWTNYSGYKPILKEMDGSGNFSFSLEKEDDVGATVMTPFLTAVEISGSPRSIMVKDDFGEYQVQVSTLKPAGSGMNQPGEWVESVIDRSA